MLRRGGAIAVAGVAVAVPAASAVFSNPSPAPRLLTVFPDRDFVSAEGLAADTPMTVRVIRNGVTIGSATGTTDAGGLLEVNHPGGVCWDATTPNILAGDIVVATPVGAPADTGDATTTSDLAATAAEEVGDDIVVHGSARAQDGGPLDLDLVEQRIINPAFRDVGLPKRDIRAVVGGVFPDGALVADPVGPGNPGGDRWTATFGGLDAAQRAAALAGQTRAMGWQATNAAGDRLGVTIFEVGEVGGPGFGGCPAGSDYAVTSSDRPAVTKALQDGGDALTISGVAQDASAVDVTLSDGTTSFVQPATAPQPASGAQTWSATFSAGELAGLADGTLTASGAYTVADPADPSATTTLAGVSLAIAKDTVAPGDPDATPGPGTYATSQAVTLDGPDPTATIHFTVNGSRPTAASHVAPAQIGVTSSLTIRAVAIDAVGNTSAVRTFEYVIAPTPPPPPPVGDTGGTPGGVGAPSGRAAAGALATPPAAPAPAPAGLAASGAPATAAARLALRRFSMAPRVRKRTARTRGIRLIMRVAKGTELVRVRVLRRSGRRLRVLSDGYKTVDDAAQVIRIVQRHRQLRRLLRRGSYEVRVTPGVTKPALGRTARYRFKVI